MSLPDELDHPDLLALDTQLNAELTDLTQRALAPVEPSDFEHETLRALRLGQIVSAVRIGQDPAGLVDSSRALGLIFD